MDWNPLNWPSEIVGGVTGIDPKDLLKQLLGPDPYAGERLDAMKHSQDFLDKTRVGQAAQRGQASNSMQQFMGSNLNPQMEHMFGSSFGGNQALMNPAYANQDPYTQMVHTAHPVAPGEGADPRVPEAPPERGVGVDHLPAGADPKDYVRGKTDGKYYYQPPGSGHISGVQPHDPGVSGVTPPPSAPPPAYGGNVFDMASIAKPKDGAGAPPNPFNVGFNFDQPPGGKTPSGVPGNTFNAGFALPPPPPGGKSPSGVPPAGAQNVASMSSLIGNGLGRLY